MSKSNSELIANLNQAVTGITNRVHELEDSANKVAVAQSERDELANAMDNVTTVLTVAAQPA